MLDMLALIFVGTVNSFFHNPRFLVVFESKPGQLQRLCGQGEKRMLEDVGNSQNGHVKFIWLWINTYENTIFNGMNIHKSQLF